MVAKIVAQNPKHKLMPKTDVDTVDKLFCADIFIHRLCIRNLLYEFQCQMSKCFLCHEEISPCKFNEIICEQFEQMLKMATDLKDERLSTVINTCYDVEKKSILIPSVCHLSCFNNYIDTCSDSVSQHYEAFVNSLIDQIISKGYGIQLSDINTRLSNAVPDVKFYNTSIKMYIMSKYGTDVSFCQPHRRNEYLVVYPSYLTSTEILKKTPKLRCLENCWTYAEKIIDVSD